MTFCVVQSPQLEVTHHIFTCISQCIHKDTHLAKCIVYIIQKQVEMVEVQLSV